MRRTSELRGWVSDEHERQQRADELTRQLVGRRVERCRYVELSYDGYAGPTWPGPDFDSLDFGLELDLDDGVTWGIAWQQDGFNETLLVSPGLVAEWLRGRATTRIWDTTEHWLGHGPVVFDAVSSVWTRHRYGPGRNRAGEQVSEAGESGLCLLTLILGSDGGGEAVISLGGRRTADGDYWYVANNVAVFFSMAAARAARVFLPSDDGAIL